MALCAFQPAKPNTIIGQRSDPQILSRVTPEFGTRRHVPFSSSRQSTTPRATSLPHLHLRISAPTWEGPFHVCHDRGALAA